MFIDPNCMRPIHGSFFIPMFIDPHCMRPIHKRLTGHHIAFNIVKYCVFFVYNLIIFNNAV